MASPGPEEGGGETGLTHAKDLVLALALAFCHGLWRQGEAFASEQERSLLGVLTGGEGGIDERLVEPVEVVVTVGSHD